MRIMLGGARRPGVAELDDPGVTWCARRELAAVMNVHAAPVRTWTWRWPAAITQYTRGHLERLARVRSCAARYPGLDFCGTSYDGISFTSAIVSAERAAARLLAMPLDERHRHGAALDTQVQHSNGDSAGKAMAR